MVLDEYGDFAGVVTVEDVPVTADGRQLTVEATRGTRVLLVAIESAEEFGGTPRRELRGAEGVHPTDEWGA